MKSSHIFYLLYPEFKRLHTRESQRNATSHQDQPRIMNEQFPIPVHDLWAVSYKKVGSSNGGHSVSFLSLKMLKLQSVPHCFCWLLCLTLCTLETHKQVLWQSKMPYNPAFHLVLSTAPSHFWASASTTDIKLRERRTKAISSRRSRAVHSPQYGVLSLAHYCFI